MTPGSVAVCPRCVSVRRQTGALLCFTCQDRACARMGYTLIFAHRQHMSASDALARDYLRELGFGLLTVRLQPGTEAFLYGWAPVWFVAVWQACKVGAASPEDVLARARRHLGTMTVAQREDVRVLYDLGGRDAVHGLLVAAEGA